VAALGAKKVLKTLHTSLRLSKSAVRAMLRELPALLSDGALEQLVAAAAAGAATPDERSSVSALCAEHLSARLPRRAFEAAAARLVDSLGLAPATAPATAADPDAREPSGGGAPAVAEGPRG